MRASTLDRKIMAEQVSAESLPVPEGFEKLNRGGPYFGALGPVYEKRIGEREAIFGVRISSGHLNGNGVAHGGMLATLADSVLGIAILRAHADKRIATVNLTTDFMEAAHPGDWVEAHVEIHRSGSRLAFAACFLQVGERRILRASGVFAMSAKV